jgi:hypothetical protein
MGFSQNQQSIAYINERLPGEIAEKIKIIIAYMDADAIQRCLRNKDHLISKLTYHV